MAVVELGTTVAMEICKDPLLRPFPCTGRLPEEDHFPGIPVQAAGTDEWPSRFPFYRNTLFKSLV